MWILSYSVIFLQPFWRLCDYHCTFHDSDPFGILPKHVKGGTMGTTILAVDDSASVRKMVQFILESKGLQAKVAENGLEALKVLKHHVIDAIILDINMPKMNGLEFLQIVKSEGAYATIPVIMLTTEGQDEDKDKAIALGASAYVVKPFKPSQLLTLLEEVLPDS